MQRYSSVILHVSLKNPILAEKKKITFSKVQFLHRNFFPEWFGPKQVIAIRLRNEFHDNLAQTDQRNVDSDLERAQTSEHCSRELTF